MFNSIEWVNNKAEARECIWCNGDRNKGPDMVIFPNPCCEMGSLSICKACLFDVHESYNDFKDEVKDV